MQTHNGRPDHPATTFHRFLIGFHDLKRQAHRFMDFQSFILLEWGKFCTFVGHVGTTP